MVHLQQGRDLWLGPSQRRVRPRWGGVLSLRTPTGRSSVGVAQELVQLEAARRAPLRLEARHRVQPEEARLEGVRHQGRLGLRPEGRLGPELPVVVHLEVPQRPEVAHLVRPAALHLELPEAVQPEPPEAARLEPRAAPLVAAHPVRPAVDRRGWRRERR